MNNLSPCPKCNSIYTYEDKDMLICPECAYEWLKNEADENASDDKFMVYDANKNLLSDGDFVTVIKDLKIKGSSSVVKIGTKVKILRLIDGGDHNIDCRIDGVGSMMLKSEFVKKAK
ncbi:MAG: zinc ribbon domain-containing protein YjdM [Rickettsiales bacterium]